MSVQDLDGEDSAVPRASKLWSQNILRIWIGMAAVGIHLCIGSVYAYSQYKASLATRGIDSKLAKNAPFMAAIGSLGLIAAFGGTLLEHHGPRVCALASALLWGLGNILAGFASSASDPGVCVLGVSLTYGLIGGAGLGLGYISPVSTLIKWFPDHRGLATGTAVMGFGLSSKIWAPVLRSMLDNESFTVFGLDALGSTFVVSGIIFACVISGCSLVLKFPPPDWKPDGFDPSAVTSKFQTKHSISRDEALRDAKFWLLWPIFFINISCGLFIISDKVPMCMSYAGFSKQEATEYNGNFAIANAFGRLLWSWSGDYLGRTNCYTAMFVLQAGVCFLLATSLGTNPIWFRILSFVVALCYGGGFSMCPAVLADMFGPQHVGAIHGVMLTGWSAAGILGPLAAGRVFDWTHTYPPIFIMAGILFCFAIPVSVMLQVLAWRQRSHEALESHKMKDADQVEWTDIVKGHEIQEKDGDQVEFTDILKAHEVQEKDGDRVEFTDIVKAHEVQEKNNHSAITNSFADVGQACQSATSGPESKQSMKLGSRLPQPANANHPTRWCVCPVGNLFSSQV